MKEEKRLSLAKAKKDQDNRAEAQRLRDEERKAVEGQREKARMEEEERRRREMERLQNMKNKQQVYDGQQHKFLFRLLFHNWYFQSTCFRGGRF